MAVIETIRAASIARVTSKSGKLLGFLVKSNSSNDFYQVTCTRIADEHVFTCTCKAGQFGFANCKDGKCCHVKAVLEVATARAELAQAKHNAALAQCQQQAEEARTQASTKHDAGRAAFQQAVSTVRAIEAKYHPNGFTARMIELEQQRARAAKDGSFSLLKAC